MQGTIKNWLNDRGFGWIAGDDGRDIFCHMNSLTDNRTPLTRGTRVQYDVGDSTRYAGKTNAINVQVIEGDTKREEVGLAWLAHQQQGKSNAG